MTLGYCMECDRLVPIRQGGQKWGSRERRWYPFPHDAIVMETEYGPEFGPCSGEKREIK